MAHHTLALDYQETPTPKFTPSVDPLPVEKGDTISFKLANPANRGFKITMTEPQFFSQKEINDSSTSITVVVALKNLTTYHCQLFDSAGKLLFQSSTQQPGGGMQPGRPPGHP